MKTLLKSSLVLVLAISPVLAAPPQERSVVYQRFFGQGSNLPPGKMAALEAAPENADGGQPPGIAPISRTVSAAEAAALPLRRYDNEQICLVGRFIVTAVGESRAVMRGAGEKSARLLVRYPAGASLPELGAHVEFKPDGGLLIPEVRSGPDGQVNLYGQSTVKLGHK